MEKKQYIAPLCEVTVLSSGSLMKYTGPASLPSQEFGGSSAPAPRRRTKVF